MKSKIMKIIFWIYNIIMLLFYFRILPKPVNLTMSRELVRDMRAGGWKVYNLVPFSSYSSFVIDPTGSIMRIIWHIAMFAMLAFLLSAAFEDMPLKKRCALLFVYALLPEVVQFVLSIGLFDIDSVIQNIFGAALGLLAAGAVCGFLPCTAENILKLAFSMLGEVYGWGGSLDSRDCSMMVHDIFACFGICLPKDTTGLQSLTGMDIFMDLTSYSKEEKEQILTRLRPGAVLGFPGHVMIYLGKTGQDYYVISQTGHFYQKTDTGFEKVTVNSCVVNSLSVYRKNENKAYCIHNHLKVD